LDSGIHRVRISIIIPAFNEELLLGETLCRVKSAMRAFETKGWQSELIVCDNNSTDATARIAHESGAIVVFEPVNQIARARNRGAEAAAGDWLIFVDADSHPTVGLFAEVAATIESGRCLAGGTTVRLAEHHRIAALITAFWNRVSRTCRWMAGSFIFCDAVEFRRVGGFNRELFAGEEIDLSRRLKVVARRTGRRIIILHRNPLVTSARKMHLYTAREHLTFLFRAMLNSGGVLRSREACHTWYDGRR
jgi:glycosyltransferase involved in cell wall biosynthesis